MAWETIDEKARIYLRSYYVKQYGGPANCLAVGYGDGLAVVSPGPEFEEGDYAFLESVAPVRALVVPNAAHRLGVREWRHRFPRAAVHAPTPAIKPLANRGIASVLPIRAMRPDPDVRFLPLPGVKVGGVVVASYRGARPVVFTDELFTNLRALPKALLPRLAYWLTGSAPGLKINRVYVKHSVTDAGFLATYDELLAGSPVVVPSHGGVLREESELRAARALIENLRAELSGTVAPRRDRAA